MHIKSQELAKPNKAKQRCWGGSGERKEKARTLELLSESVTVPISKGLAPRTSGGNLPLLHLDIIAPPEDKQVSSPRDPSSNLPRHVFNFFGLTAELLL